MSGKRAKTLRGHGLNGLTTRVKNMMEEAAIHVSNLRKWVKKRFRRQSYQQITNPRTCANRYVKNEWMRMRRAGL